jgi:hypothetical protein
MKEWQDKKELLTTKVYDLIARTSIELGLRTDGKTMASLAKILAEDLLKENRFQHLNFAQIVWAFRVGVRFANFEPYLNIRTFYRWIIEHKKTIDNAYYQVHTLNRPKEEVPYYEEPKKLLK